MRNSSCNDILYFWLGKCHVFRDSRNMILKDYININIYRRKNPDEMLKSISGNICYCHEITNVIVSVRMCAICISFNNLTYGGWETHICVCKLTTIASDNSLSCRRQAIIWTNDELLLIVPLGTKFSEIVIEIHTFPFTKCIWKCRLRNGGQSHVVRNGGSRCHGCSLGIVSFTRLWEKYCDESRLTWALWISDLWCPVIST